MIVLFIKARLENVAKFSLPPGYTYTVTVRGTKHGMHCVQQRRTDNTPCACRLRTALARTPGRACR